MLERRFRWLLRLLPRAFREDYEREIVRVWHEELRDAPRAARTRVWRRALIDTLRAAPREHLSTALHNLRVSTRSLAKAPGFTVAAVLTLALGTGATAAVFSLLNAVVLRPLPWEEGDAVGLIWAISPTGQRTWLSAPELVDLREEPRAIDGVAGFTDLRFSYSTTSVAREVDAIAVSHDFFRVLGVRPALGRDFAREEDQPRAARVVVLSDRFWRTQLGADPAVIGRSVRLNEMPYTVVGVLPGSFEWLQASSVLPSQVDVWVALEPHLVSRDRSVRYLHAIGRLRDGTTFDSASAELSVYARRAQEQFAGAYPGGRWSFLMSSFARDVLQNARTALLLLLGLVVLVLLMACTNVANLLLARGEARRAELSVRTALGAGPARLAGELMSEALVLAAAGTLLGFLLAVFVPQMFRAISPAALPRLDGVGVDRNVALLMAALVFITTIATGFVPLLDRVRFRSLEVSDRSGGRSLRAARIGRALIGVQTALSTTVVAATIFFAATFAHLQRVDLGLDPRQLLTLRASVLGAPAAASSQPFFEDAVRAIARVPGVEAVGAVSQLPLSGAMLGSTFLDGPDPEPRRLDADLRGVTGAYFDAVRIPLLRGRLFRDSDDASRSPVALVDETFAATLSAEGEVVGRRVRWIRQPDVDIEIIGVVGSVRHRRPEQPPMPTLYRPIAQYPRTAMFFTVRTSGDPARYTDAVTAAIGSVSRSHPVADIATMEQRVALATSRMTATLVLSAMLAALALLLGSVGLYGVISFGVLQRRREFGVRLALGATSATVRRMVVRDGLAVATAGVVCGVIGGFIVARAAASMLYGISLRDPVPYAAATAIVMACSMAAFWVPARRASRVDPVIALRSEP